MYFVLQTPSLRQLAGVKIVAHVWSHPDILTEIAQSFNNLPVPNLNVYTCNKEWKAIEEKVKGKIGVLPLPETCKTQLLQFAYPIGTEINIWCQYHNIGDYLFTFLDNWLPQQLCWTMRGIVDYAKTAQLMVKDERLSVERRFELACINCLEDEARQLIQFIPNDLISLHKYFVVAIRTYDHRILVAYFVFTLHGDVNTLNSILRSRLEQGWSINNYLFEVVLYTGNRATCEYFFKKVSQEEKLQVLNQCHPLALRRRESPICGLMFYLLLPSEEQQGHILGEYIYELLTCLLRWPMQSLFVKAAECGWQFLDKSDNCAVGLSEIIRKTKDRVQDYDYSQLFWVLWRLCPAAHQQHFLNSIQHLEGLFATKREEFIRLVLNQASWYHLKELLENRYDKIGALLLDESVICDAALVECKETAALNSENDKENVEKRLRSENVSRFVDIVMEWRTKRRSEII